ncbi:MAG TPA: hypothetical protein VGE76_18300 [Opitutaceae bacterium]
MAARAKSADGARWAISGAAGLAVALGVVSIIKIPKTGAAALREPARAVRVQRVEAGSATLGAASTLRDLTPLFLPTERNAGLARLAPRAVDPAFYQAPAAGPERAAAAWHVDRLPPPVTLKEGRIPVDAASDPALLRNFLDDAALEALAKGMGRDSVSVGELSPRGGVVEVVSTGDGLRVLTDILDAKVRPPTEKVWQPLVLLAHVGPAGLVRPLSVDIRSGIEEVDLFFQNYLARSFRIGERLPPGFYRITVAP